MWRSGRLTEEYRRRMYKLLALYAKPLRHDKPVVCIDEKCLQLIGHSREPLPMTAGNAAKHDYESVRKGTTNLFVAVEPKAGQRVVCVTEHRGKTAFVSFAQSLPTNSYAAARRVHIVLDDLNSHFRKSIDDLLESRSGRGLLPAPAQTRTCGTTAYGSCLES